MIDPRSVRPRNDNVLVRLELHERRREDKMTPGGIFIPRNRDRRATESAEATVIAAGPGHYHDRWLGHDKGGSHHDGTHVFVPMDPGIQPGAAVLVDDDRCGDRLYSDEFEEFRMVREHNLIAILEE